MSKIITIVVAVFISSCAIKNNIAGNYQGGPWFWKYSVQLRSDSTFSYKLDAHMAKDSATGTYSFSNDSILIFTYNFTKADSSDAMFVTEFSKITLDSALYGTKSNIRDRSVLLKQYRLIFKGFKLKKVR